MGRIRIDYKMDKKLLRRMYFGEKRWFGHKPSLWKIDDIRVCCPFRDGWTYLVLTLQKKKGSKNIYKKIYLRNISYTKLALFNTDENDRIFGITHFGVDFDRQVFRTSFTDTCVALKEMGSLRPVKWGGGEKNDCPEHRQLVAFYEQICKTLAEEKEVKGE